MSRHRAAQVTPFALMIPLVGMGTAAIVLGERITLAEAVTGAVVLAGLALAVLGPRLVAIRALRRGPPAP
jgi:O-acetylserine/cysteine efflux transporter